MSLPEEDLTCPICHEIFEDPVVLSCSHSFCRRCQERCWDARLRECPVCRKKASKSSHFPNLALRNICEAVQARRDMEAVEERMMCHLHREKYKLFCLVDKEPICVVCQCSKAHKTHQCSPVEEAALDCKEKLNASLESLQDKVDNLKKIHKTSADVFKHIKNFKDNEDRNTTFSSDNMCGVLIDVANHLSNLKYKVWEKMLEHIDYTPVTLDPNTAHPCLILSDNLTSLHHNDEMNICPDNPERFHMSAEVVGMTSLGSGSHRWVVETGSNQDWLLGVASSSISRNAEVNARPENGFWTLCFRDGQIKAMTSPPTALEVSSTLERVKVHVDYDKGIVSFFDGDTGTLIYAYTHTFQETLLPYFYTQSSHPLRIMPERVLVAMLRQ
ncbi:zinc finger protein RFP isoform X2 [Dunckerocampus dactyliophorus]|uniref:zinc finger protein RFP isoform X2 n=1 Tax=Dunckerocampus dactyliophorus TaxID=161453 RepID=UPI002404BBDF|nr:zinc finger protein RFP isoform X2 [Dunckerocampus dactyliophorus]